MDGSNAVNPVEVMSNLPPLQAFSRHVGLGVRLNFPKSQILRRKLSYSANCPHQMACGEGSFLTTVIS